MAIVQHQLTAWVWQATAADRRLGFVVMTRAEFDAAKAEGRAQDPRVGALHLKHISRTLFEPPEGRPAPEGQMMRRRRPAPPPTEA